MYHKVSLCPERIHTALKLESVVLSHKHRRVAARSVEVLGTYDYKNATVVELPPFVRYGMRKYWEKQWRQITWADWRIARLREDVKDLAKATWNHENAVEDFGTAPRPIKESPVANTGTAATTNESPVADITAATEASEESQIANTATEAEASEESPIANTATEAEASEESPIANTATEAEASEESQIASTATEAEASEENPPANTVESGVVGEAVGEEETKVN
ncbi:hypothetical protein GGS21DRAFT_27357 [Xylaria nigripes]|nr:hypothetical protein GGS21DRAFT_27357 [Xylaria nigripes]